MISNTFSGSHFCFCINFFPAEDKFSTKIRDRWLKDLFDSADKNGDGTLDVKEVLQMMKTLNVGVSKKVVKKMFKVRVHHSGYIVCNTVKPARKFSTIIPIACS